MVSRSDVGNELRKQLIWKQLATAIDTKQLLRNSDSLLYMNQSANHIYSAIILCVCVCKGKLITALN